MNKVAVVILNYRVSDYAVKCIKSVQKSTLQGLEIILVDNNSGDLIESEVKSMEDVDFIQTGENFGFTGGNNIGIKRALKKDADYIFILNPDTEIDKNAIEQLTEALTGNIGIVGPKIYFSGSKKIWFAGGIFDKANVIGKHRGVDEADRGQYDKPEETGYVSGAAMMVKREVFEKIGFLDERYFLYYEDSDFCFRAKNAGFKIMYVPDAIVYHENAKSTGLGSSLQDYFITRNRMLFASKFLPIKTRFALFREALRNIKDPIKRLAFFDFLTGNFGKGHFLK